MRMCVPTVWNPSRPTASSVASHLRVYISCSEGWIVPINSAFRMSLCVRLRHGCLGLLKCDKQRRNLELTQPRSNNDVRRTAQGVTFLLARELSIPLGKAANSPECCTCYPSGSRY